MTIYLDVKKAVEYASAWATWNNLNISLLKEMIVQILFLNVGMKQVFHYLHIGVMIYQQVFIHQHGPKLELFIII